jgi:hypothetical protein
MSNRRTIYTGDDARLAVVAAEGRPATLSGYALVWDVLSTDRGGYVVRLRPGSATFATPTLALWHHEFRDVLGSTANGTLRLMPDNYGVRVEIDLPHTNAGRDVAELVRRGDVSGMSFAMVDDPKSTTTTENGQKVVNAEAFVVDEVSVVANPAFLQAHVGVKDEQPTPAVPLVPAVPLYAERTKQSLWLQRQRLELYRLPRAEFPRAAG